MNTTLGSIPVARSKVQGKLRHLMHRVSKAYNMRAPLVSLSCDKTIADTLS